MKFNCPLEGYCHMPFLFRLDGKDMILFSHHGGMKTTSQQTEFPPWRLWVSELDGSNPIRIETGMRPSHVECSGQVCLMKGGDIQITFIGGEIPEEPFEHGKYRLYRMRGSSFSKLSKPEVVDPRDMWTGFETDSLKAVLKIADEDKEFIELTRPNGQTKDFGGGKFHICRLAPVFDCSSEIVVSFEDQNSGVYSACRYNVEKDVLVSLTCGNTPLYKVSILGDKIAYTKMVGEPEKREIHIETLDYNYLV